MTSEQPPQAAAPSAAELALAVAIAREMAVESAPQRINRELIELLNEIRVALPGVQVLLAFLLAVPFSSRFAQATSFQRGVYYTTVALTVVSTVVLIAPSAYHRLNFRRKRKDRILFVSNRLMIAGLALLALALTGVVVLVTNVIYSPAATAVAGGLALMLMVALWFVLPLAHLNLSAEELEAGDEPVLAAVRRRRRSRGH